MEEIKFRIDIISKCVRTQGWPPVISFELCFLQFRMITELLMLGCLVAHGDIPETHSRRFRKSVDMQGLMNQFSRIHPPFYPRPGRQIRNPDGTIEVANIEGDFLAQPEVSKLYARCGEILHKGSFKSVFMSETKKLYDFKEIEIWSSKIINLLNHHQISLHEETKEFWVIMHASPDGRVHGFLFERIGSVSDSQRA